MKIDPRNFEGFGRVLTGVVVPRPIALVSTKSPDGIVNLAPFSFFNAVSYDPPIVVFSSARRAGEKGEKAKDTLTNVEATGEFVIAVVVDEIAEAMNRTAAEYPTDVNEFEVVGFTEAVADLVAPPMVSESPVNMECRLVQVVPIGDSERGHGLVIGEIVQMHIRDDIINGHRIDQQKLKPTGRLAGNMYCYTTDTFEMVRPVYDPAKEQTASR